VSEVQTEVGKPVLACTSMGCWRAGDVESKLVILHPKVRAAGLDLRVHDTTGRPVLAEKALQPVVPGK